MNVVNELLGIYGARGHGRDVLTFIDLSADSTRRVVFIDDDPALAAVCGIDVVSYDAFMSIPTGKRSVLIAMSSGKLREAVEHRIADHGIIIDSLVSPNAIVSPFAKIGVGALISPFAVISSNVKIGKQFHCNTQSLVAHDCRIGDYVTFSPGVRCNGCIDIHDYVFIGAGASIIQGTIEKPIVIGQGAFIGMGAVVLNDVPAGAKVVGNPARVLTPNR